MRRVRLHDVGSRLRLRSHLLKVLRAVGAQLAIAAEELAVARRDAPRREAHAVLPEQDALLDATRAAMQEGDWGVGCKTTRGNC